MEFIYSKLKKKEKKEKEILKKKLKPLIICSNSYYKTAFTSLYSQEKLMKFRLQYTLEYFRVTSFLVSLHKCIINTRLISQKFRKDKFMMLIHLLCTFR